MTEPTAEAFIAALWANQSDAELEKIGRYFKAGEGDYGAGFPRGGGCGRCSWQGPGRM